MAQTPQRIANLQCHLDYPINYILPDPKGFLWLATEKGLVRYDGSTVETYAHDPNNPQSLPANWLSYLYRDAKTGLIWIATFNAGLVCFDPKAPKSKAFTTYTFSPKEGNSVGGNSLSSLEMDDKGHLWIGGDNVKLTELDVTTRQFTRHTEGVDSSIYTIVNGGNGLLWLGTGRHGLALYDTRQRKTIKHWEFKELFPKSSPVHNIDIMTDMNNVLRIVLSPDKQSLWYLYMPLGLVKLDLKTDKIQSYPLGFQPFDLANMRFLNELTQDSEGKLWIGHTQEGMVIFNPETQEVERRLTAESETARLKLPIWVNDIYQDTQTQQTWIGTSKGLFSYSLLKNNYTELAPLFKGVISSNKVVDISENLYNNERAVWILTDKEVIKMDALTRRETDRFPFPPGIVTSQWSQLDIQPSGVYVRSENRLSRIDEKKHALLTLPIVREVNGIVDDTLPDGEPIQWIPTYDAGLFRIRQNGTVENFRHLPHNALIAIHRTPEGTIWISTERVGLIRLKDKRAVSFDHFINDPKNPLSLPDNFIFSIYTDSKNRLWLGGYTNGFARVENPNADQPLFHRYPINIPDNPVRSVMSILEDADGNFWTTDLGVKPYLFNPNTLESSLLKGDGSDILPNRLADKIVIGQGRNGIWLTNTEGVIFIDKTNDYVFPKRSLPIYFTGLTIFDKDETARLTDSTVTLAYQENFFSLKFSALNYDGNTQYRYKLEGVDKDWVKIGSRNVAYYTDLQNGTYTFRVRASVGVESDNDLEKTLEIVIKPPFWKTWWFRLLALIVLLGTLFWLYKNHLQRIKFEADLKQKQAEIKQKEAETAQLRAEFQQKIAETQLSALRAQMNPHFIFNCLNSLNLYILENHADLASDYLQRFSKLIRLVLENSRLERIPLSNEVEALTLYMMMESMRFKEKLAFNIEIDPQIDIEMITIPPLLLQPFIENAVWHGLMHKIEGGTIILKISQPTDTIIHAEIIDNGIGRAAAALIKSKSATRQKSFGMKVTGERIAAINQIYHTATKVEVIDLYDEKGQANGTKVVVEIPI